MRKAYVKMYLESWDENNYLKIATNEEYCTVGGLMNLVKIQTRLKYIGD